MRWFRRATPRPHGFEIATRTGPLVIYDGTNRAEVRAAFDARPALRGQQVPALLDLLDEDGVAAVAAVERVAGVQVTPQPAPQQVATAD